MTYLSQTSDASQSLGSADSAFKINTILSGRGIILSCFLLYLFYVPVSKEVDIIASVFVYVLGTYIFLLILFSTFFARRIKSQIQVNAFQPESLVDASITGTNNAVANTPALFVLSLNKITIPPGYYLEVQAVLEDNASCKLTKHIITGRIDSGSTLNEEVIFPHRGYWKISYINFFFADKFNLTYFNWKHQEDFGTKNLLVEPTTTKDIGLPVISSSSRIGDTLPDTKERRGDPYDLKSYHPSDGIRRILWKVYAKTGELIARHPEASMTPEGQVLVFALAHKEDEDVCAASIAYLNLIEDLNLELLFGCLGMDEKNPASTAIAAKELLIDTVWNTEKNESASSDIQKLVTAFSKTGAGADINKLVFFCSKRFLCTEAGLKAIANVADFLDSLAIQPYFCVCSHAVDYISGESEAPGLLERLFFNVSKDSNNTDIKFYNQFLSLGRNRNWEIEEQEVI